MSREPIEVIQKQVGNTSPVVVLSAPPKDRIYCRDCVFNCNWRKYFLDIDDDYQCPMLESNAQIQFSKSQPVFKENIEFMSALALSEIQKLVGPKDIRDQVIFHRCIIEHKKAFYPEIEKQTTGADKDDPMLKLFKIALGKNDKKE